MSVLGGSSDRGMPHIRVYSQKHTRMHARIWLEVLPLESVETSRLVEHLLCAEFSPGGW